MNGIRAISGFLGVANGVNAAAMILFPEWWYLTTPGLTETGPFNPHFVVDIGFIYLVSGAGFALWALRPGVGSGVPAMAAAWPTLHALFHLLHWGERLPTGLAFWTELVGVIGIGLLAAYVAWRAMPAAGRT